MPRYLSLLLALVLMLPIAPVRMVAGWPTVRGELGGEVRIESLDVTIPWRLAAAPDAGGGPRFVLSVTPPEGDVQATLALDADGASGSWQLDRARLDAAAWWGKLAPRFAPDWTDADVTGEWIGQGRGTWREGEALGPLQVVWNAPRFGSDAAGLVVEEVRLDVTIASGWSRGVFEGDGRLTAARGAIGGAVFSNAELHFARHADGTVRIESLFVQAFGGAIKLTPMSWKPGQTEVRFGLAFDAVDLESLAAWLPDLVHEAHGQISGQASFRWREDLGVQPLGGSLTGIETNMLRLRLAPLPGFLTRNLPRKVQILPRWLGGKWLAPENPVYPTLEGIELGREPLNVEVFNLEFFPPDDPLGRTASIRIAGRPQHDPQVERVSLTINLTGPLTELIKLGLDDRVQFGSQTGD